MNFDPLNTLGISLGTRSLGIAVIVENELVDWYIKTFRGAWSEQKKELIMETIDRMLERYTVNAFAVKIPDKIKHFPILVALHNDILTLAKKKEIPASSFTIYDLKRYCGVDVTNKAELRSKVFESFPELKTEYNKEIEIRNAYYTKLFEATLAAQVAIKK